MLISRALTTSLLPPAELHTTHNLQFTLLPTCHERTVAINCSCFQTLLYVTLAPPQAEMSRTISKSPNASAFPDFRSTDTDDIDDRRGNIIRQTRIHNQYGWSADPVLIAEDLEDPDDIGGASFQRPLHSTGWSMAVPRHKDARWWVRWPTKVVHYMRTRVERLPRFLHFTLTLSYINILLVFLPIALAAQALGWSAQLIVAFNALSLSPLAFLIAFFAEELSSNCTKLASYLIESLLVNAVWLIVSQVVDQGEAAADSA